MTITEIRALTGLSQGKFCEMYRIPVGSLHNWEQGIRNPPEYVLFLLEKAVRQDFPAGKKPKAKGLFGERPGEKICFVFDGVNFNQKPISDIITHNKDINDDNIFEGSKRGLTDEDMASYIATVNAELRSLQDVLKAHPYSVVELDARTQRYKISSVPLPQKMQRKIDNARSAYEEEH